MMWAMDGVSIDREKLEAFEKPFISLSPQENQQHEPRMGGGYCG